MLDISRNENGDVILTGRFDASQVEKAKAVFNDIDDSCVIDFKNLDYIASAGLGVLLMTQKKLKDKGKGLKLINMNKHISDVFVYAGFNQLFEIE